MSIKLGVVMDAIDSIHYEKDSTLALLFAAQARGWSLHYFQQPDLFLQDAMPYGTAQKIEVFPDAHKWFALQEKKTIKLADLDIILMRKDPPVDENYICTTYILEQAERLGVKVINRPQSLRDVNEKLFALHFPQCIPPSLVTAAAEKLQAFLTAQQDIVCKPLNSMGGESIFRVQKGDVNAPVIFATLTQHGKRSIMAQQFIPAIAQGDKRILMLHGEPVSHALLRVPQAHDWRGNLAAGAKGVVQALTPRDHFICQQVGPELRKRGLYFVGLDVIGDYLTEINVTSPTCIRELDAALGTDIAGQLLDILVSESP